MTGSLILIDAGRGKHMKTIASLVFVLLAMSVSIAGAQDAAEPAAVTIDTSKWKCKFCEFEEGWYADVTLGLGDVSDDSYKFGEYNGLQQAGSYLIGEANARYRSEDASYLDLSLTEIGLDTRSFSIRGGRQGSYDIFLRYHELPHLISDSASTPYLGNGSDVLTLPAGWVGAGTTAGMTALTPSLREVDLETQRKRLGTGISITTDSPWSYRVNLRRDDKEGSKRASAAFLFNSAQLVEPVDYVTDEIDATIAYTEKNWQASIAYYISTFSNNNESLTWDNAYAPADQGQLALPPDNEFQQLTLSAAYQFSARNHLSGDIALGHMQQDEKLLQATLNPALLVPPLPTDSADAEIDTLNARLKFASRLTDKLRLSVHYSYDERDNKTPQLMYDWVITDTLLAAQRGNLPYSYTRNALKIKTDYDYAKGTRLGLGVDFDERERSFQEIDETSEDTLWGTLRVRNIDNLWLELKFATSSRDVSNSKVVAAIDPAQNPLMTKYHAAGRHRDSFGVFASVTPQPEYTVGLGIDIASDDYDESELGLTSGSDISLNIDVTAMLSETTSISLFVGHQKIESSQAGSQGFAGADWLASNDDRFDNVGVGMTHMLIEDRLDIGADLTRASATGKITTTVGGLDQPFPELRTRLDSLRIYANYRLDENLSLRLAYWYEKYASSDWALDDVAPDTVTNLLSFGEQSPDYDNNVVKLALQYRF